MKRQLPISRSIASNLLQKTTLPRGTPAVAPRPGRDDVIDLTADSDEELQSSTHPGERWHVGGKSRSIRSTKRHIFRSEDPTRLSSPAFISPFSLLQRGEESQKGYYEELQSSTHPGEKWHGRKSRFIHSAERYIYRSEDPTRSSSPVFISPFSWQLQSGEKSRRGYHEELQSSTHSGEKWHVDGKSRSIRSAERHTFRSEDPTRPSSIAFLLAIADMKARRVNSNWC